MRTLLLLFIVALVTACHLRPPEFPMDLTDAQREALSEVYLAVWRESRDYLPSRRRIDQMLALEDDSVRSILSEAQWQVYDAEEREDWVEKIYRTTRNLSPVQTSGPRTTPPQTGSVSGPPNN